jgi:predicted ribosome quality control (RQC) complex YloA/Tae2 family protein
VERDLSRGRGVRAFRYALPGGWTVLAGRSDADNDRLSIKLAEPDDWWFHVRGMPGSHVILHGPPGAEADRETLRAAAAIAAFHSKARAGGVAAVSCTRARHVTKPRGAKSGTVEIRKETVLKVRPALPPLAAPEDAPDGETNSGGRP